METDLQKVLDLDRVRLRIRPAKSSVYWLTVRPESKRPELGDVMMGFEALLSSWTPEAA